MMEVITASLKTFECSGCSITAPFESWRDSDGPCRDGLFYCTGCLTDGKCGCIHKEAKKP